MSPQTFKSWHYFSLFVISHITWLTRGVRWKGEEWKIGPGHLAGNADLWKYEWPITEMTDITELLLISSLQSLKNDRLYSASGTCFRTATRQTRAQDTRGEVSGPANHPEMVAHCLCLSWCSPWVNSEAVQKGSLQSSQDFQTFTWLWKKDQTDMSIQAGHAQLLWAWGSHLAWPLLEMGHSAGWRDIKGRLFEISTRRLFFQAICSSTGKWRAAGWCAGWMLVQVIWDKNTARGV